MCDGVKELKDYERHWHLDKRVPIALIFTVVGQFLLGVIMGTLMWAQIQQNTKDITIMTDVQHQVIRIQSDVAHMNTNMGKMAESFDKLADEIRMGKDGN